VGGRPERTLWLRPRRAEGTLETAPSSTHGAEEVMPRYTPGIQVRAGRRQEALFRLAGRSHVQDPAQEI